MLKEFRVTNYKSINKEQVFSMEACPQREISEHPSHVIEYKGERLLKVSSFYGPNGGGKTNLLDAFLMMRNIVIGVKVLKGSFGQDNFSKCVFSDSNDSVFEAFFVSGDYEIGYSLTADLNKTKEEQIEHSNGQLSLIDYAIIKEEMCVRRLGFKDYFIFFTRNADGLVDSDVFGDIDLIKTSKSLPKNKTFLSYFVESFDYSSLNENQIVIFNLFREFFNTIVFSREYRHYTFDENTVKEFEPFLKKASYILNGVDIRIKDLVFKPIYLNTYCLYVVRETENGMMTEIQVANESKGTKKLINIIFDVLTNSDCKLFIADDFDACLHPKLVRAVIELFTSLNNNSKQLVFNSHDIVNMNNQVFRRDEIWFAYRDENYSTNYLSLANIVDYRGKIVRKDASYGKQYLEGKYGADPFIKKGMEWE